MGAIRLMQWIASGAGLGALALGVGGGIVQIDLSLAYLVIGGVTVLSLLALSIMLLFIPGMRLVGIIGLVDALIIPILLLQVLVDGTMHGLVQATYVLIALDIFGFMHFMSRRSRRLLEASTATSHRRASFPRKKP
jgi:hypothetical protein